MTAVRHDLSMSPAAYLAAAAAGADAAKIVSELKASGVDVRNARMVGTSLVVSLGSGADVATVRATGAVVDDGPAPDRHADTRLFRTTADVNDGSGWAWTQDGSLYNLCSVGFVGYQVSTGGRQILSAGHCFADISGATGPISTLSMPRAGDFADSRLGAAVGTPVANGNQFGGGFDAGLLSTDPGITQKPAALTWGNGSGAPLASTPIPVFDEATPIVGAVVCKSGIRTGWTCGHIAAVDEYVNVSGNLVSEMISNDLCSKEGDSGGAVLEGFSAIAIMSGSIGEDCSASGYASAAFELRSPGGYESVAQRFPDWEPAVTVPTPTVTTPAPNGIATVLMTESNDGHATTPLAASVSFDGGAPTMVTAPHNGFQFPLSGLTAGTHTYSITTRWGTWSTSATVTGSFRNVTETRVSGADRFVNADLIAKSAYPTGASTVYLTNGLNYPDALGAGPSAMRDNAPILLTTPTSLPSDVAQTLVSLDPTKVVVLGGVNSVSPAVLSRVASLLPSAQIVRRDGVDRFAASRSVVTSSWPSGAPTVFITNGLNFPDALSAGPAAHTVDAPLLLVDGPSSALPEETLQMFQNLGTTKVVITGGPASVSTGIEAQLVRILGASNVVRLGGADRYAASVNINAAYFTSASAAFIATGENFPDALAGGAWAGSVDEPMYTVHHDCIPAGTSQAIAQLGVSAVHLLGGTSTLTAGVVAMAPC
ncbi:cell wall-binding repeat-containing protein [Pseudolysinimonas kribbensis]|uniref:cell wall-binding repeat-containing protein n=1 Tax=Pseudolysinimonas kribbensis TaxID=433641 RepID=UPI0024E045BD|nr:cell wall-binding repeat-containing protein [Pseudolysinimonas kribbensis]